MLHLAEPTWKTFGKKNTFSQIKATGRWNWGRKSLKKKHHLKKSSVSNQERKTTERSLLKCLEDYQQDGLNGKLLCVLWSSLCANVIYLESVHLQQLWVAGSRQDRLIWVRRH